MPYDMGVRGGARATIALVAAISFGDKLRRLLCAILFLGASYVGCSVADRSAGEFLVRDSAGVEIILNRSSSRKQFQAWSLSATPELRIGASEGDSLYQFYRVAAVRTLPDGRIVVANAGTRELRFYDPFGAFISRVGRDGAGPGEFRSIDRLSVVQDSIWVSDPRLTRVSVFTLQGRYVRSVMLSAAQHLVLPRLDRKSVV